MRAFAYVCALLCLAVTASGCGGGKSPAKPGDEDGSVQSDGGPTTPYTYHHDIAPILAENCLHCHSEGGIGSNYGVLTNYENVFARRALVSNAVETRRMPQYGADASGECQEFKNARWLEQSEIDIIVDWVKGGAPEGEDDGTPAEVPPIPQIIEGTPDLTLSMPESYETAGTDQNDYRCILVETGLEDDMYLTGYEVAPGTPEIVHHVLLFEVTDDAVADQYRAANGADGKVGFPCTGSILTAGTNDDVTLMFSWLPGALGQRYPAGTGLKLHKGKPLIMQMHYNYSVGVKSDLSSVKLDLEPVTPATTEAVLYTVDHKFFTLPGQTKNKKLSLGWEQQANPVPVKIWGVYPHMHHLGRVMNVQMNEAAPSCLVNADRYKFEWQEFYFYKNPITFPANGQLKVTCEYDTTSRNDTVTWGEGTENEMCLVWFYVTL